MFVFLNDKDLLNVVILWCLICQLNCTIPQYHDVVPHIICRVSCLLVKL